MSSTRRGWRVVRSQATTETNAYRDVHDDQQVERSDLSQPGAMVPRYVFTVVLSALAFAATWLVVSGLRVLYAAIDHSVNGYTHPGVKPYYRTVAGKKMGAVSGASCYQPIDQAGHPTSTKCYGDAGDVPKPAWWTRAVKAAGGDQGHSFGWYLVHPNAATWLVPLLVSMGVATVMLVWLQRTRRREKILNDPAQVLQDRDDARLQYPEEVISSPKYDVFPDVGATSPVKAYAMLSHAHLTNDGLDKIRMSRFMTKDDLAKAREHDENAYVGKMVTDADGNPVQFSTDMIDLGFSEELFEASFIPKDKALRRRFNPARTDYNSSGSRDRTGKEKTLAEHINKNWGFNAYETQRPAGVYVVDPAPVNVMLLAITRAGKGQTYIEPMLDMWTRELQQDNIVVNDPKGELLVKFYTKATVRGYEVKQFNLINPMKTDVYNPLGLAAQAARAGNVIECAQSIGNIGDVFFPVGGGDDPMWANAAANAFKRAAYGLIDFYLEEEREMRLKAAAENWPPSKLEARLDVMWGHVTLYNCYQMFVQLSARRMKNPVKEVKDREKAGYYSQGAYTDYTEDERMVIIGNDTKAAEERAFMWNDEDDADKLSLFFSATEALPSTSIRKEANNAHNALKSMGKAEKMLGSVYGIAVTALNFFTDPTIARLTSGLPSQNVDLVSFGFPRRMGVRFNATFVAKNNLVGKRVRWTCWKDADFTEQYTGKEFTHEDTLSDVGWARAFFEGIFPADVVWVKLEVFDSGKGGLLMQELWFKFTKEHRKSLNKKFYIEDQITGQRIVDGGTLQELRKGPKGYRPGHLTFSQDGLTDVSKGSPKLVKKTTNAVLATDVSYTERPKMLFFVTPPHLMIYAKLVLISIKQLFDVSVANAYMTKDDQKPLYANRYMFDELGNLQNEGHGIDSFTTMLSIGLGQKQFYTMVLQTLAQLREVYGESAAPIVQGNSNDVIFLKSTDDAMLQTLETLSGKTHKAAQNSITVTEDVDKIINKASSQISRTTAKEEHAVIKMNDMLNIKPCQSMVFRAGDYPIWNRNEMILPMAWRLHKGGITNGEDYSLQTVPSLSTAIDFDIRNNQPDFNKMLDKRMAQAAKAQRAMDLYIKAYGLSDDDLSRRDPDVVAAEVMGLIADVVWADAGHGDQDKVDGALDEDEMADYGYTPSHEDDYEDEEAVQEQADALRDMTWLKAPQKWCEGTLTRQSLLSLHGEQRVVLHDMDPQLEQAVQASASRLRDDRAHFVTDAEGSLYDARDPQKLYVRCVSHAEFLERMREQATDPDSGVQIDEDTEVPSEGFQIADAFIQLLLDTPDWSVFGDGEFERELTKLVS